MAQQGLIMYYRLCAALRQDDPARLASVSHPPPQVGRRGGGGCDIQAEEVPESNNAHRLSLIHISEPTRLALI
eukprot:7447793-Alexandrium_andersonii.AAC.1